MKQLMHVLHGIPMADFHRRYLDPHDRLWIENPAHHRHARLMIELADILEQAQVGVDLSTATQMSALTFRPWGDEEGGQVNIEADWKQDVYHLSYYLAPAEAPWPFARVAGECLISDPALIAMVQAALEHGLGPQMLANPVFHALASNTPWHDEPRPPLVVDESEAALRFRERRLVSFANAQADGLANFYQNPDVPLSTDARYAAACREPMLKLVARARAKDLLVPPYPRPEWNWLRWSMAADDAATVGLRPFPNDSWFMAYSYPIQQAPWPGARIEGNADGWEELEAMLRIAFDRAFRPQPAQGG